MSFDAGRFHPDPGKDDIWNRGDYLVEALAHCAARHSERDLAGAIDISGSSASGIKEWSVDEVATYLKTGEVDNVVAAGRMAEVVDDGLSHLTDADIHAMAVYLKDLPPPGHQPTRPESRTPPPQRQAAGDSLYAQYCATCHQADGTGVEHVAPTLVGAPSVVARQPYNLVSAVIEGFAPHKTWMACRSLRPR